MSREIRIYVEGGGDGSETKADLRRAFSQFFTELHKRARTRGNRCRIITCGGRSSTFDAYKTALRSHRTAVNVLLVDAEGPVTSDSPWEHLKARPGDCWENPGAEDKHCHLMVQTMEAWLIADREMLAGYFGKGFRASALPDTQNVELIPKDRLEDSIKAAARETGKKTYLKTRDAPRILQRVRPAEVRQRASYCARLFTTLLAEIDAA